MANFSQTTVYNYRLQLPVYIKAKEVINNLLQMRTAYDAIILREKTAVLHPEALSSAMYHHYDMLRVS